MRGKNIIWLSFVAMLLVPIMMINFASAPSTAKVYIDPPLIPEDPEAFGHPGDVFPMSLKIANVHNVWSLAVTVQYKPFARPLVAGEFIEGAFMGDGWIDPNNGLPATSFVKTINPLAGKFSIGITRLVYYDPSIPGLVDPVGASGDGTLVTFKFNVVEAGDSAIEITECTLLDTDLQPIPCSTFGSTYQGPTVKTINFDIGGRGKHLGTTWYLSSKAQNKGDVPLKVRAKYKMTRDDGKMFTYYSGQMTFPVVPRPTEYLYVDGFESTWAQWTTVGTSPWLDAVGDGNYIQDTINAHMIGKFTFQNIVLGSLDIIKSVSVECYTFGPYDESNDFDLVAREPLAEAAPSTWLGSAYSAGTPGWTPLRWISADEANLVNIFPAIATQTGINNFKMRYIQYYTGDGAPRPPAGIDAMRLKVEFAAGLTTIYVGPKYEVVPPFTTDFVITPYIWEFTDAALGKYYVEAVLEYSYFGSKWTESDKIHTFSFWVDP